MISYKNLNAGINFDVYKSLRNYFLLLYVIHETLLHELMSYTSYLFFIKISFQALDKENDMRLNAGILNQKGKNKYKLIQLFLKVTSIL